MQSYATRLRHFASSPGQSKVEQEEADGINVSGEEGCMSRRHKAPTSSGSDVDSKRASLDAHSLQIDEEDAPMVAGIEHAPSSVNGPPLYNGVQRQGGYHYHPRLVTVEREDPDEKPRRSFCRSWCEMWFLISKSRATCIGMSLFLFGGGLLLILLTGAPCMMVQFLVFAWGVMLIVLTALTSGGITKPCDLPRDAPSVVNITLSGVADSCHSDTKVIVTKSLSVCAGALMILMNCYWLVLFAWNKRTRDNRENRSFTVPGCLGFFLAALFFFVTGALAMGIFQHYELFVYGENCLLDQGVCDEIVLLTVPLWAGSSLAAMILILLCACCMMCFILT